MKKTGYLLALLLPRLQDIIFICIFAGANLSGMEMLNTDGDLGRHLTIGRIILKTLRVPTRDLLSHTLAGEPRPPYEWLAQLIFAGADHALGLDGVVALTALLLATTMLLLYRDSRRRSSSPLLALLFTLWAAAASSLHWLTRPHIFTFLFLAIWLSRLERLRTGENVPLWHFPALMLVWANTHGGFIFGLLAWLAYFMGGLWQAWHKRAARPPMRTWLLAGISSLGATFVTPDSWHNWEAVFGNHSRFILSRTVETMPPDFRIAATWPFAGLFAIGLVLLALNRHRVASHQVILLAGLGVIALLMARNIPLFAIAAAPIFTTWAAQLVAGVRRWPEIENRIRTIDESLHGFVWPVLITTLAIAFYARHRQTTGSSIFEFDRRIFPVEAADWIEDHPPAGNMFNDFNWGGYLLYRLWPEERVYVDSQSDFYGEPFMHQYERVLQGTPSWQQVLNERDVSWLLVRPGSGLAREARASADWEVGFEDAVAIIFIRK
jgi:hypothetical protein